MKTLMTVVFTFSILFTTACADFGNGRANTDFPISFSGLDPVRDAKTDGFGGMEPSLGGIDGYNDPSRISEDFVRTYRMLPTEGRAGRLPWTDTYWPKNKGGISHRWRTDESHTYAMKTQNEIYQMTPEEIELLSPAEKYDLYVGDYTYPLTHRIRSENGPGEASWTGYCHGWAQASIHFEEPQPVVLTNADGVEIRFGSSDVKALLTYFQGEVVRTQVSRESAPYKAEVTVLGTTCGSSDVRSLACTDSNPGAFHIILTNKLGIDKEAFGIDAVNTYERWNHPVHHYKTTERGRFAPSEGASPEAVTEVLVSSVVTFTTEIEPQHQATNGTNLHADKVKTYTYTLELDAEGTIVGGQWVHILTDGSYYTLNQVYDYFKELDENGDGNPDFDLKRASAETFTYFDFPDYIWFQEPGVFGDTFRPAQSNYELQFNTTTNRKKLFGYFAKLKDIYEASIAVN